MKTQALIALSFCTIVAGNSYAQGASTVFTKASDAQNKLDTYIAKQKNTAAGNSKLMEISGSLPKTKKNIDILRQLVGEKITQSELIAAIGLLGSMYDKDNLHGENQNIKRDLKNYINGSDKKLATTALFAFTRTGYDPEYLEIIRRTKERGLINDDDYYGEHAHLLRFSPESAQGIMLDEIEKSRNKYSLEVLSNDLKSQEIENYSVGMRKKILKVLKENEPALQKSIGEYGGAVNYYYENWLYSNAKLSSAETGDSLHKTIFSILSRRDTDPRKIMAFFESPIGKRAIKETKDTNQLKELFSRMCGYANSFPTTNYIQMPARNVEASLADSHAELKGISCSRYD